MTEIDLALLKEAKLEDDEEDLFNRPFVDSPTFNVVMCMLIIVQSLLFGVELDSTIELEATMHPDLLPVDKLRDQMQWYAVDCIFGVIFLGEFLAKFSYMGTAFFKEGMNIFDFVVVMFQVVDVFILTPFVGGGGMKLLVVIRMLRIVKLARLVRLLKFMPQLYFIVTGVSGSLKALFWACVLLYVVIYTAAIYCTISVGHADEAYNPYFMESGWDHEEYFGTTWASMLTLFQITTRSLWMETVVRHILKVQPGMALFWVGFVMFSAFGVLNIVIAVIIENTLGQAKKNRSIEVRKKADDNRRIINHVRESFERLDEDSSGTLTINEVNTALQDPEVYTRLKMVNFPVDDPMKIFFLLDVDNSGSLETEEFIKGCMRMQGAALSKDMLEVLIKIGVLGEGLAHLENQIGLLVEKIGNLDRKTESICEQAQKMLQDRIKRPNTAA